MKSIVVFALMILGCDTRPLPCTSGTDCSPSEWCVETWRSNGVNSSAGNICATRCTQSADCGAGTCAEVGDGATLALDNPAPFACRE